MKVILISHIAMLAHEANRAYCLSLGDDSQPAWADAPEWQQQSALAGVEMHAANPDATPEQSHESWLAQKTAQGWVYGEVKDAEKKTHPCCRPYAELPPEQKAKDYIFRGVVHAMLRLAEETEQEATSGSVDPAAVVALVPAPTIGLGEIAVTYIGRRPTFTDTIYGTGLTFAQQQTRVLPDAIAAKFLRHPDVFAKGTGEAAQDVAPGDGTTEALASMNKDKTEQDKQLNQLQDLRDSIQHMNTKAALEEFARTNYKQELDKRKSLAELRTEVIGFIDRFGAV